MKLYKVQTTDTLFGFHWMAQIETDEGKAIDRNHFHWDGTPFRGPEIMEEVFAGRDYTQAEMIGHVRTKAEMTDLIVPTLVELAKIKIQDHASAVLRGNARQALRKAPYINAVWILRSTPEEIDRWADRLAKSQH